jgi:hypothetical protein
MYATTEIINIKPPLEAYIRIQVLVVKLYDNLGAFVKHLLTRHKETKTDYRHVFLKNLVDAAKPANENLDSFLLFMEQNLLQNNDYGTDPKKLKILKNRTKNLPNIVESQVEFNSLLHKLIDTTDEVQLHRSLSHMRDFKIRGYQLIKDFEEVVNLQNGEEESEDELCEPDSGSTKTTDTSQESTINDLGATMNPKQLMKNLAKVNKKAIKTKSTDALDQPPAKKRKRAVKVPRLNKRILETMDE